MCNLKFRFALDGTWNCKTKDGRYDISVDNDGRFLAWHTDNAHGSSFHMSRTQVVYTLRQAKEWCERYEIMLNRKRSEANVRS